MRYRSTNTPNDLSRDVAEFVNLIGEDEYGRLLTGLGKGLNYKGYVTATDDLRFYLELQLLNLELFRRKVAGQFQGAPEDLHEAVDLVVGIGQTIPHLSAQAQAKLRGRIIGGLKTSGLRTLQHEMRVACRISQLGCDVVFADMENSGGYDFIADKNGLTYEVEAKALTIFSGQSIQPQDADKFFLVLRNHFIGWKEESQFPILNVILEDRLPSTQSDLFHLAEACNIAASTKADVAVGNYATVHFVGAPSVAAYSQAPHAAQVDALRHEVYVYVSKEEKKAVVRISSKRPGQFIRNLIKTVSEASRRQLSGDRPGIIWIHVDFINVQLFDLLAYGRKRGSLSVFDLIALAIFDSPKRTHVTQLMFSGGAQLLKTGDRFRSGFRQVIYNSPSSKFGERLFPDGRALIGREHSMRGSVAKELLKKAVVRVATTNWRSPPDV